MIGNELKWQTYAPYLQGYAKIELEKISREFFKQGVATCIYNCPEILTNSSSIFQGVEVPLYPLLKSMKTYASSEIFDKLRAQCAEKLKDPNATDTFFEIANDYLTSPIAQTVMNFEQWPQHSRRDQMELMLKVSDELIGLQKSDKDLVTGVLSEVVFKACGYVMLHDSWAPRAPVQWIGHDVVAKAYHL